MSRKEWAKTGLKLAGFGTAMAAAASAQNADAAIVNLTFTTSIGGDNVVAFKSGSSVKELVKFKDGAATVFAANQYNDNFGGTGAPALGRTINQVGAAGLLVNWLVPFQAYSVDVKAAFGGGNGVAGAQLGKGLVGTNYIGFKGMAGSGNGLFGWVKLQFGGPGGAVTWLDGAYENTLGTTILVGQKAGAGPGPSAVPEPSSLMAFAGLSALALGAAGLKRKKMAMSA